MKLPLIDDAHRVLRFYSVWVLLAIFVVSVAEVIVAFYVPPDMTHAVVAAVISGVLAVAGIVLRTIKQRPRRGKPTE